VLEQLGHARERGATAQGHFVQLRHPAAIVELERGGEQHVLAGEARIHGGERDVRS
jgi:hypothetical protein